MGCEMTLLKMVALDEEEDDDEDETSATAATAVLFGVLWVLDLRFSRAVAARSTSLGSGDMSGV